MDLAERYHSLLMRTLTRFDGVSEYVPEQFGKGAPWPKNIMAGLVNANLAAKGLSVVREIPFDGEKRRMGRD